MVGKGKATCGAIQDGQDLCGVAPATFESNAIGDCPAGSFADVGRWGCYTCPTGFDRGIAAVDSDRACTKVKTTNKKARLQNAKLVGTACPDGTFYDPIRGGECWSCPAGYVRSAAHIDWADACAVVAKEGFIAATEHSKATGPFGTDCPAPTVDVKAVPPTVSPRQFWDGIDGKCHSCPTGYVRTGYSVHDSRACSKLIPGKIHKATLEGQSKCQDGEIADFLMNVEKGGSCYTCPDGYDRTVYRVDGDDACETTPDLEFSVATKLTSLTCPEGQIFDFISTRHPDVKTKLNADKVSRDDYDVDDDGTCWSCPPGASRSWSSVTASDACVLSDVGWKMPVYNHVGLFGLDGAAEVVLDIIKERKDIESLAISYAKASNKLVEHLGSTDAFVAEVWQQIADEPEESSILALTVFARLEGFANKDRLEPHERRFLNDFEKQVTDYRSAMAQEALNILKVWQDGAALRYIDPRFNTKPDVVARKLLWASIGVLAPPISPPDFAALVYDLEETPLVSSDLVLGITAAERGVDQGVLKRLMPNDPVGDLGGRITSVLKDKAIGKLEEEIIERIERQMVKKAIKDGTVTAKMIFFGPNSIGPQIAIAIFIEYADQWVSFIADAIDAEPKLKANLAQAQQTYSVKRKLETQEGGFDLRASFKTIMNPSVRPSSSDRSKIKSAVAMSIAAS
jgi:hypothetical protein